MLTWRLGYDPASGRFFVDMPELGLRLDGGQTEHSAIARLGMWVRLYMLPEARV